jgi:hypothetical protein
MVKYADVITKQANLVETLWKMGMIKQQYMIQHSECPLKYLNVIKPYSIHYKYENIKSIGEPYNWLKLSSNTNYKVVMANIDKPWDMAEIGSNESFTFENFELLLKQKNKLNYIPKFHTITSKIVSKYKSYFKKEFKWINGNGTSIIVSYVQHILPFRNILTEVIDDHPDIFTDRLFILWCKDFSMNKCTDLEMSRVKQYCSTKSQGGWLCGYVNQIWECIDVDAYWADLIYKHNKYITVDALDKYLKPFLNSITSRVGYYHRCFDDRIISYLIDNGYMTTKTKYYIDDLLRNKNLSWKFIQKYKNLIYISELNNA